jgi:transcription initiation factor TFIID subunit 1
MYKSRLDTHRIPENRHIAIVQKDIDKLKRWDRVHCIRDLSTKAASDNMGDGLERFARGEKMKLSDQKKIYTERIQEIWNRQKIALSEDSMDIEGGRTEGFERAGEEIVDDENVKSDANDDDSGDDENDDFL